MAAASSAARCSGSLLGAGDTDENGLRRRCVLGLVVLGAGLVGSSLAPVLAVAMATFALSGLGNGLFVVSDRVLLQRIVPERLRGRITFALAGVGTLLVWLTAVRVLRRTRPVLCPAVVSGACGGAVSE